MLLSGREAWDILHLQLSLVHLIKFIAQDSFVVIYSALRVAANRWCNLMKKTQFLAILSFSGLIACNTPETYSEKLILIENNLPTQIDTNKVLTNEIISELDTTKNKSTTVFSVSEQTKEKRDKKPAELDFLTEGDQLNEKDYIIPGFVKNEFIKKGNTYYFKRIVKKDEDSRVGNGSAGNEMSFSIVNSADTFLIENEMLKTLNFKYQINGELYWEEGKNPYKGYIKGMLSPDNTWQIEISVWIKMRDLQLNKEIERQIIVNDKFIL